MKSVIIRKGEEKDLPAVYERVQELAVFEKAGNEVETSIESYLRDYKAGWFKLLIAETKEGENLGIMLYYSTFSTWKGRMLYLEDFVVKESARRQNIGEKLWKALITEAKSTDCRLIKWQVLDWNHSAKKFYKKMGSEIESGWENGKYWL